MKTLYVSDLDKTLLRDDQTISDFSKNTIEELMSDGMIFTYATARSASTAKAATCGLKIPYAIVYNGAFIVDTQSGEQILSSAFEKCESEKLINELLENGAYPRVFSMIEGKERFTYTPEHLESLGAKEYFRTRKNDPRARLGGVEDLFLGEIFLISCCGEKDKLSPLYDKLKESCICHFYPDSYSPDHYLELLPKGATKASAVLRLKEHLGCDKVVAFGDAVNDISMFEIADECYAVSNACDELKAIATAVIPSNEEDGVAKWLSENKDIATCL